MTETLELLDRLIALPSVSADSNLAIIDCIVGYLGSIGAQVTRISADDGLKAGLLARIGPAVDGGALLSAHTDVVPVEGQAWTRDPFRLTAEGGRLYGRGTADMKGFLSAALAAAGRASRAALKRPLLLSLSWDEETGCLGIRSMRDHVLPALGRPELCIVGEPTQMRVATGHKGKGTFLATCQGQSGHSALAPRYCNALHLAAGLVLELRDQQERLAQGGARDAAYDIPYSTVHAGRIDGGAALNIVADSATVLFEIRHLAEEPLERILAEIRKNAQRLVGTMRHPSAAITIGEVNRYPELDTSSQAPVVAVVQALAQSRGTFKVAYGTEAGYFAELGIATVVCGPGSMEQGHRPDEFVDADQLGACDAMLDRLIGRLSA